MDTFAELASNGEHASEMTAPAKLLKSIESCLRGFSVFCKASRKEAAA